MMPPTRAWSEILNSRMKSRIMSPTRPPKRRKKSANGSTTPSRMPCAQLCACSRSTAGSGASRLAATGISMNRAMARYTLGQMVWSASTSATAPVTISAMRYPSE